MFLKYRQSVFPHFKRKRSILLQFVFPVPSKHSTSSGRRVWIMDQLSTGSSHTHFSVYHTPSVLFDDSEVSSHNALKLTEGKFHVPIFKGGCSHMLKEKLLFLHISVACLPCPYSLSTFLLLIRRYETPASTKQAAKYSYIHYHLLLINNIFSIFRYCLFIIVAFFLF